MCPENMRPIIVKGVACLLVLGGPSAARGWSGRLHMDISREAARSVPEEMAGWRKYARLMAHFSVHPDLWKETDAREDFRHYIDLEAYAPLTATRLPRDSSKLAEILNRPHTSLGQAPWVIMDLQAQLTAAMASNDWPRAARLAAAQGHYVADLYQPLHTTENFDGQKTGHFGIHLRWELEMPGIYWRSSLLPDARAEHLADPWTVLLENIAQAHARCVEIFKADEKAARLTDFNVESRAYYQALWQESQMVFIEQAHRAACALASLWYTAWVDAGRPAIPAPPESLPETSIWQPVAASSDHVAWPFLVLFGAAALLILALSLRRRPPLSAPRSNRR